MVYVYAIDQRAYETLKDTWYMIRAMNLPSRTIDAFTQLLDYVEQESDRESSDAEYQDQIDKLQCQLGDMEDAARALVEGLRDMQDRDLLQPETIPDDDMWLERALGAVEKELNRP